MDHDHRASKIELNYMITSLHCLKSACFDRNNKFICNKYTHTRATLMLTECRKALNSCNVSLQNWTHCLSLCDLSIDGSRQPCFENGDKLRNYKCSVSKISLL